MSIEMKLINIEQVCSMHLCTRFGSSRISRSEEIGTETWQNVTALSVDKPKAYFDFKFFHSRNVCELNRR